MFDIKVATIAFVAALENVSGVPIAILDRIEDPQMFWVRTAAILCEKTGDNFCDTDVRFMTANTEIMGMSRVIEYRPDGRGATKRVCAIIPPMEGVSPVHVPGAFAMGGGVAPEQYPSFNSTYSWLMLYHAAGCLNARFDDYEDRRSIAFATLGLTVLQGDPTFTAGVNRSQSRRMAALTGRDEAHAGAAIGERILLDLWKDEAADVLRRSYGCNANVRASSDLNIERIPRDRTLRPGEDCAPQGEGGAVAGPGIVSDSNLWIWMYGQGGIGAPPKPYAPVKSFADMDAAARYVFTTSESISR